MKKIEKITALYEIAEALNATMDLRKSLYAVLHILSQSMGMTRGTITILNRLRDEIRIEVAHGLSRKAIQRGRYKPGEGITGRVIQQGKAIVVPKISEEPLFLNRTASRRAPDQELSFICVPIKKGQQVVGALSVDLPYNASFDLKAGQRLLSVVSTMLAQRVINLETLQMEKEALREENQRLHQLLADKHSITNIVGNSNKMREVFQMISQVCRSNATVLLRGESGTGKELVANAIHYNSKRAKQPFIKVNCAALPSTLIESELFGHERGAFTGAIRQKRGKFELANKGTIFLDEIGSLSTDLQVNLLRVLQEKEFERVGGTRTIKTDVRVIAATNRNLEEAVAEGSFRGDLYYRLNVFPIYLPPLRARKTDILLLADHFLEKYAEENHKDIRRFSTPAIDMLMQYHWPGNVRELENCIERAVLLCEGGVIRSYHLPPTLQTGEKSDTLPSRGLEEAVAEVEREMIIDALKNTRGNMAKAADLLQITQRKFGYKARKYGVDYRQYR
ncbi:MAG: nif-specific transcriptional activator NifA [Deltaproteobacteria bacterium]|nr:nif-specific transcriptional activator NifA [Deltaproteobacteria bacterium]MBW2070531.1 nif-specific transcriptional activator NifA [Deltaproteobacteria bacterium]